MSERYTANVSESTTLEFQFLRAGTAYDAYSVNKVTIHSLYADAVSNSNIVETISSGSITRVTTGLYQYTASIITTPGTYFDKIFLTPTDGGTEISFINTFYVSSESVSTNECNVYGTILDSTGEAFEGVRIYAIPTTVPAFISTSTGLVAIGYEPRSTVTDSNGYFTLALLRNLSFNITIKEIGLRDTITVPDDSSVNLFSLLGATVQASTTPADTNWT